MNMSELFDLTALCRFLAGVEPAFADPAGVTLQPFSGGVASLGRAEGYVKRQIEGWAKRYRAARTDDVPRCERIIAWLEEQMPAEAGACLVHNDFKFDNVVVAPDDVTS